MRRKVTAGFGTLASRQAFMSISGLFNLYFSVYFFCPGELIIFRLGSCLIDFSIKKNKRTYCAFLCLYICMCVYIHTRMFVCSVHAGAPGKPKEGFRSPGDGVASSYMSCLTWIL